MLRRFSFFFSLAGLMSYSWVDSAEQRKPRRATKTTDTVSIFAALGNSVTGYKSKLLHGTRARNVWISRRDLARRFVCKRTGYSWPFRAAKGLNFTSRALSLSLFSLENGSFALELRSAGRWNKNSVRLNILQPILHQLQPRTATFLFDFLRRSQVEQQRLYYLVGRCFVSIKCHKNDEIYVYQRYLN